MDGKGLGFPDNIMALFAYKRVEMDKATIPNDVCRCLDSDCKYHTECSRWINRAKGSGRISMANSLWKADEYGMCTSFVDEIVRGERA